jgi:hypothetical protein
VSADRTVTLRFAAPLDVDLAIRKGPKAVAGAKVEIIQDNGVRLGPARSLLSLVQAPRMWRTDEEGELRLEGLAAGTYRVRVDGRDAGLLRIHKGGERKILDLDRR